MTPQLFLPLIGLALGAAGAALVAHCGSRVGLLDLPGARSSHTTPTPKGGGIGILAAFLTAALFLQLPPILCVTGALIAGISLLGDRVHLAPAARLVVHVACAAAVLPTTGLPLVAATLPLWLLAILFVAGTANYYNFMDGSNGMAGITGLLAFALLALAALAAGNPTEAAFCTAIATACLGFLPWNVPRARVFMGDVGSVLLGFLFARTVLVLSHSPADFLCLVAFLFPFYADELLTTIVRLRSRERLTQAHRRHLYQILVNQRRVPHLRVALLYGLVQLLVAGAALALHPRGPLAVATLLAVVSAFAAALSVLARRAWEQPARNRPSA